MKKKISLLLTGILTLGLLTGCGGSGAESGTAAADVGTDAAQSTEAADAGTDAAQDVQTEEPSADAVEIVAWHDNDEAMMNALADVVNEKLKADNITLRFEKKSDVSGQIRLYGAVFCLVGGAIYFWAISPWLLKLGYLGADLAAALLGILTFPLGLAEDFLKKFRKIMKNIFLSGAKWYRIGAITEQLDTAARRRTLRERGERGVSR